MFEALLEAYNFRFYYELFRKEVVFKGNLYV